MPSFTVGYRPAATAEQQIALADFARAHGATVNWSHNEAFDRSYALIEGAPVDTFGMTQGVTVFESPVIALAIRPNVAEALPALAEALGGSGRPAGVIRVENLTQAVVVEWNLDRSPASLVLGVIDIELARFRASRVTELLSPLPLAWWTAIAAEGLCAPEIAPDRVLEALIEEQHVAS